MNPHTITYYLLYNQSDPVLLGLTERLALTYVPCALVSFIALPISAHTLCNPYPQLDSAALTDGLSVNNELQRKWLDLI
jgi:hypothetical protein